MKTGKSEVQEGTVSKDAENIWVNLNKNQQYKIIVNIDNVQFVELNK